ncbi:hypothetical protein A134_23110 [Vibrio crassostreae 9CS106]|uniref:Uncharacterized protein n=1 Tax=Vibrio crassostreae 9CS106 TaxID=1191300 RepID=A0A1B1C3A0_9VIBR|nr:hypothetical protein A134_23110 [Vibrio crassostreae 9CS106]
MSLVSDILEAAGAASQELLGESCLYTDRDGATREINVDINRSKEVNNEFGILAGYSIEAIFLISDVPLLAIDDTFIEVATGEKFRVSFVGKETKLKYYCDVVQVD